MRLGVTLPQGAEAERAAAAEEVGVPFVHVVAPPGTESVVAATVVAATSTVRVVVGMHLGTEHPVTLAEEAAVLDNLSNGRIAVVAELGSLDEDEAIEELALLRASWSGRPITHRGRRWNVPAGLPEHDAPSAVAVTPAPAQIEIPLWVAGSAAAAAGRSLSLPVVATTIDGVNRSDPISPGRAALTGQLDADRGTVAAWSQVGATHLLCELPERSHLDLLARWLIPEVAMVNFPRVVADAPLPAKWPRDQPPDR